MIVYPFVLHLGPIELTGYGLMMMVAFLMAGWAIQLDLRQRGLDEDYAADIIIAGDRRPGRREAVVRPPDSRSRRAVSAGWFRLVRRISRRGRGDSVEWMAASRRAAVYDGDLRGTARTRLRTGARRLLSGER